jgi:hypothetical protein
MPHNPSLTLTGWKEISSHLRVTVRTAQLWEKQRGLPIHRYPGEGKPRVYAYPEELEAWLRDSPADPEEASIEASQPKALPRPVWVALAILVLASTAWLWKVGPDEKRVPVRCTIVGKVLQASDHEDHVIWQKTFPNSIGNLNETRTSPICHVLDADLDGTSEVYFQFWGENRLEQGGELIRMTDDGDVDWRRPFGRPLVVGDRKLPGSFTGNLLRTVQIDGRPLLLATAAHTPHYPGEAALIDPRTGDAVDTYYHPGNFYALAVSDVDGNDDEEVLLAAINNPGPGPGHPALVILDLPFSGPDGSQRVARDFFGNPGPKELAYFIFPRADVDQVTGTQSRVSEIGVPDDGPLTLGILSANGKLNYSLDIENLLNPRVLSVVPEMGFRMAHDHLADEGLVDHRLGSRMPEVYYQIVVYETAPDGNAPEVALALGQDPERGEP